MVIYIDIYTMFFGTDLDVQATQSRQRNSLHIALKTRKIRADDYGNLEKAPKRDKP